MNVENVKALAAQLQAIGVEDGASALLKRICFRPKSFAFGRQLLDEKGGVNIQVFYQETTRVGEYRLLYYDVSLIDDTANKLQEINGRPISMLDAEMETVDWAAVFRPNENKPFALDETAALEGFVRIEGIVSMLAELELTPAGTLAAAALKQTHWAGFDISALLGTGDKVKDKTGAYQRFYIQDGDRPFSIDEARRFLLNKLLEKQMQASHKRAKQPISSGTAFDKEHAVDAAASRRGKAGKSRRERGKP